MKNANYDWLKWSLSEAAQGGLPPDVRARIDTGRDRASGLQTVVRTVAIRWVEDHTAHARLVGAHRRMIDPSRRLAAFISNGRRVVLEAIGGGGVGPTWRFRDVRIYLDGELAGRGVWGGSCLGCSLQSGPAVAMLRDDLALRVDSRMENLELLQAP